MTDYQPPRYRRPRFDMPTVGHPIVREFFHIAAEEQMSLRQIAKISGQNEDTIAMWKKPGTSSKRRRTPMLESMENVLKPLGYKLAIVPETFQGVRMSYNLVEDPK